MGRRLVLLAPIGAAFLVWLVVFIVGDLWHLFADRWFMTVTMVFGSFIAGASSEGGGAVAFPVMTLLFEIPPPVARNFSLAIQSVGMVAAAYLILATRIPVAGRSILWATLGGAPGVLLGTLFVVPHAPAPFVKMLFVSFWLAFGVALWAKNHWLDRPTADDLPVLARGESLTFVLVGFCGGIVTSLLGSGIDIVTFSYTTMRYGLSEKVATPTSVVTMAINTVVGFFVHLVVVRDFGAEEMGYWLVCIPVVLIFAPIGAWMISLRARLFVAKALYAIIVVQFVGACYVLQPSGMLLVFTVVVFFVGLVLFALFLGPPTRWHGGNGAS
ncbi:MAG: sulfite exporter TauE/SafE family protein [Acidobacteriota bacterium]